MPTMILLSSSPPPIFAREPTPYDLSPLRDSMSAHVQDPTSSPKRFKRNDAIRDTFSAGFTSARSMLATKPVAENMLLHTPGKERFKIVSSALPVRRSPPLVLSRRQPNERKLPPAEPQHVDEPVGLAPDTDTLSAATTHITPVANSKIVRRRRDWTPVEDEDGSETTTISQTDQKAALMDDFGFRATSTQQAPMQFHGTGVGVTNRTRIDPVQAPSPAPIVITASKARSRAKSKPAAPKRVKAAPKKTKTITDLVTSHHRGTIKTDSPMAGFLVATQARNRDCPSMSEDDIEVATKASKRKAVGQKTQPRKRQLLSPSSAMKAFGRQKTVFGSASQLARDDPRVELTLSSDPVSPLRTQATSYGSITPRGPRGSKRFVNTRNLWGAADRDEDNALLHVESVDLFDTPDARTFLAGKDALLEPQISQKKVQPGAGSSEPTDKLVDCRKGALPGLLRTTAVVDIDSLPSPASVRRSETAPGFGISTRTLHTSARRQLPAPVNDSSMEMRHAEASRTSEPTAASRPEPNYAGMQTGELQKLIKGYGFKAIKSREKMVDLLGKCWKEKEARRMQQQGNEQVLVSEHPAARHTDLISNVHDLSARPQPKLKKGPKKTRSVSGTKKPSEGSTKEPKKRKNAASKTTTPEKPKKPRAPKSRVALSKGRIHDTDDVDDDFTTLTTLRQERTRITGTPETPIPHILSADNVHAELDNVGGVHVGGAKGQPVSDTASEIGLKIHGAILHQSEQAAETDSWDHVRSPTWHEKMLLYDPIIIDDLTRWLNAEGLNNVQEDREVTSIEVRDWCESKGVCCMWKGGWRGQASKGGD